MAEWSKALVLGTSHFDGVGSNPTAATYFSFLSFAADYFTPFIPILFNFILYLQSHFGEFDCKRCQSSTDEKTRISTVI